MEKFLDHRVQVIRRRTEYLLREAKRRGHVLEGQLIAIANIEEVINICRTSPNRAEAKQRLQGMEVPASMMERASGPRRSRHSNGVPERSNGSETGSPVDYQMTEQQAEAVVRLQLGQLAALERDEILKEYTQLREQIRGYETLLSDEANILAIIRADLEQMASKYGDDRKTEITDDGGDVDMEDLIEDEPNVVTITHEGFIKRMPLTRIPRAGPRRQGRAGRLARQRLRRALLRRPHEGVSALLHEPGPAVLAEGLQDSAGRAHCRRA